MLPVLSLLVLAGCGGEDVLLQRAMALRAQLLAGSCAFTAHITADYGDAMHSFSMDCVSDAGGGLEFTVSAPDSLKGITGTAGEDGGHLTFNDKALAFALLADGQLSPVSAPWVLMKTLRSGYLTACGRDGQLLRLTVNDSYAGDALMLDIWLGEGDLPQRAEILWQGRRILTLQVENFRFV